MISCDDLSRITSRVVGRKSTRRGRWRTTPAKQLRVCTQHSLERRDVSSDHDSLCLSPDGRRRRCRRGCFDSSSKRGPALVAVLARDDELCVSERHRGRCAWADEANALKRPSPAVHAFTSSLACFLY